MQSTPSHSLPDCRDFAAISDYLEAVYLWRKSTDPSFSYSLWSRELGFNSRVFVKMLTTGKRTVTEKSIPLLIRGLRLTGNESSYFTALARLARAKSAAERETQLNELCRYRKPQSRPQAVIDHFKFLSSPINMRVQAFLSFQTENPWTSKQIAKFLSIRQNEAQESLQVLASLGMAKEENGGWRPCRSTFEVNDQPGSAALQALHRKSLEDAIRAISLDPEIRKYLNVTTFLTSDELAEFHERVRNFAAELLNRFSNQKPSGARLYQAHFSLIPVSESILQPEYAPAAPVESQSRGNTPAFVNKESFI